MRKIITIQQKVTRIIYMYTEQITMINKQICRINQIGNEKKQAIFDVDYGRKYE